MGFIDRQLRDHMGFLTDACIDAVIQEDRLYPCLVRCGCGRFSCPAQDVRHFVAIVTAEGSDYVRDVSLLPRGRRIT